MLGIAQVGTQRHDEARGTFEEAQNVAPADARAYNYEARVRLGGGDAAGARKAIERGLAHVPGDQTLKAALVALNQQAGAKQ
jgi:Flp pilus assembly protein TadD